MEKTRAFEGIVYVDGQAIRCGRGRNVNEAVVDLADAGQAKAVEALFQGRLEATGWQEGSRVEARTAEGPVDNQAWVEGDRIAAAALLDGLAKANPPWEAARQAAKAVGLEGTPAQAIAATHLALAKAIHPECVQLVVDCIRAERAGLAKAHEAKVARDVAARLGVRRVRPGLEEHAARRWLAERTQGRQVQH